MSAIDKINYTPKRARELHIVRTYNKYCRKQKYHLCVEAHEDRGGLFVFVSTGYPADEDIEGRLLVDHRIVALPRPLKSDLSSFNLSKTFPLTVRQIQSGIDFGPISATVGKQIAGRWNVLRNLHKEEWRRHYETFVQADAPDPTPKDRAFLDHEDFREEILNKFDTGSLAFRANAKLAAAKLAQSLAVPSLPLVPGAP